MYSNDMKLAVTYTIITQHIKWYVRNLLPYIAKELKYEVNRYTCGEHKECETPHYHICVDYDTVDSKYYKTLNEKIQRIIQSYDKDIGRPHPELYKDKIKISFVYEGYPRVQKKKTTVYNPTFMQYPFKEMTESIIYSSVQELQHPSWSVEELDTMRECAHLRWLNSKREKANREAAEKEKENKESQLKDYLDQELTTDGTYDILVTKVITLTLRWKRENEIKIRTSGLKDAAINYLYYRKLITEDEIIEHIKL